MLFRSLANRSWPRRAEVLHKTSTASNPPSTPQSTTKTRRAAYTLGMRLAVIFASCLFGADLPRMARSGLTLAPGEGAITVVQVAPDSNAARAGIANGDAIVDAAPTLEFARSLLKQPAGSELAISVRREGKTLPIRLRFVAPPLEQHAGIRIDYRAIDAGGHLRRTILTRPARGKPRRLIVWIAGSGCGSQESPDGSNPEVELLYTLTKLGFATLRVEKTGVGDSQGPPCYSEAGGIEQEVNGYRAAIAATEAEQIFLFGHSAGATLAPLVARGLPVRAIVLNGAMSGGFFEYILAMRRRESELAGTLAEASVHERCLRRLLIDGVNATEIESEMPECRRKVRFDSPPSYVNDWLRLDLASAWRQAPATPVLVLYGTGDFVTSAELSEGLVALINAAHPRKATLRTLPMDHGFRAHATQRQAFEAERSPAGGAGLYRDLAKIVAAFLTRAAS